MFNAFRDTLWFSEANNHLNIYSDFFLWFNEWLWEIRLLNKVFWATIIYFLSWLWEVFFYFLASQSLRVSRWFLCLPALSTVWKAKADPFPVLPHCTGRNCCCRHNNSGSGYLPYMIFYRVSDIHFSLILTSHMLR